ncbi:hypothetical protein HKX48_002739 [Thoreauomyces humboldtii]|nr:hypothetical protein HKX48_002739 [Thoreauomyces humboldtii]
MTFFSMGTTKSPGGLRINDLQLAINRGLDALGCQLQPASAGCDDGELTPSWTSWGEYYHSVFRARGLDPVAVLGEYTIGRHADGSWERWIVFADTERGLLQYTCSERDVTIISEDFNLTTIELTLASRMDRYLDGGGYVREVRKQIQALVDANSDSEGGTELIRELDMAS